MDSGARRWRPEHQWCHCCPRKKIFVCFFIPESQLARAYLGQKVAFERDNGPADLGGTISFIAPQAEYTLPFIFSESNRGKLVFLAEARPPKTQAALLNPGEPVTGTPAAGPP